jgi:predicted TIM-barrel fold metal-dependent hydrolase
MVSLARKYPNVYIDTSAYTTKRYPPELVRYLQRDGRKKVMFGSNWPMIAPEKALEDLATLELDEEASRLFLGETARKVFNIPPARST